MHCSMLGREIKMIDWDSMRIFLDQLQAADNILLVADMLGNFSTK